MNDGKTATIDKVLGFDKKLDIAILATSATNTKPVTISKTPVQVGDTVYAIGYPEAFKLGFSSSTFTSGMVSMNRSIEGYSYIQSTVNITHGNSGGALINKYGEVVGITTAGITYSNIDYMNLSIPIQRIDTVSRNVNVPLDVVTKRNYPVYATFYSDGTKYTSQSVRYEGYAYEPTAPTKTGYSFAGWYADSSFNTKFNFNTKLTSNVSVYAKWVINTYSINYDLNSGTWSGTYPAKTYTIDDCGKALPIPIRSGYVFEGWKDSSGNYINDLPNANSLKNLSLCASWVKATEGLIYTTSQSIIVITGYTGNSKDVVIPKRYHGLPITKITSSAFKNKNNLKSIIIPDSVTSIEGGAFSGCSSLENIVIPFIGAEAGVTNNSSYQYPFGFIFGMSNYTDGVATKQEYAGQYGFNTTSTFYIPSSLKNVTVTGGKILYGAFYNCSGLTSITIPDSVTSIGNSAFFGCKGLTSITIPDRVTSIGYSAFYNCTGLSSITIPDRVTSIGSSAFYNTAWYSNQPDGLVYAGKVAYDYKGTMPNNTSIVLKEGTLGIADSAFRDCTGLTSITIPDSVKSIGFNAFAYCSGLTSVTIGNGVTSIGSWTFSHCTGLTSITFNGTIAQWNAISKGESWKYRVPSTCKVVCTDGTTSI